MDTKIKRSLRLMMIRCGLKSSEDGVQRYALSGKERIPAPIGLHGSPGEVCLLAAESGMGKRACLGTLGDGLLESGERVLALGRPEDWEGAVRKLAQDLHTSEESLLGSIGWVLIAATAADDRNELTAISTVMPKARVIAASYPQDATELVEKEPRWRRFELLPIELATDKARLLEHFGASNPIRLLEWLHLMPLGTNLTANSLFLQLAANVNTMEEHLPHLALITEKVLDRSVKKLAELSAFKDGQMFLEELASESLDGDSFSEEEVMIASEYLKEVGGAQLRVLFQKLVDLGVLNAAGQRYTWKHTYFPVVLIARRLARREERLDAAQVGVGAGRAARLLTPLFAEHPLRALEEIAKADKALWLRGVSNLPPDFDFNGDNDLKRGLCDALFGDLPSQGLRHLEDRWDAIEARSGFTEGISILQNAVKVDFQDPQVFGCLLWFIERLAKEHGYVAVLADDLVSRVRNRADVSRPGSEASLARTALSNEVFNRLFPEIRPASRSPGPAQPKIGLSWLAARLVAKAMGGRLPKREEWESIGKLPRGPFSEGDGNLKSTHRYLRSEIPKGKTLPVDHELERDPTSRAGYFQMLGNVREWMEDGPEGMPERRYALGGSYKADYIEGDHEALESQPSDVGVRVFWDEERAEATATRSSGSHLEPTKIEIPAVAEGDFSAGHSSRAQGVGSQPITDSPIKPSKAEVMAQLNQLSPDQLETLIQLLGISDEIPGRSAAKRQRINSVVDFMGRHPGGLAKTFGFARNIFEG